MKTNDLVSVRMNSVRPFGTLEGSPTEIYSTMTILKLFDGKPVSTSSFGKVFKWQWNMKIFVCLFLFVGGRGEDLLLSVRLCAQILQRH